ncbi:MAG: ribose 5-phosphate isomerase B [Terriglobia bacterium]
MPEKLIVAVGSDHAGFALKERVREYLQSKGYGVEDCGVHSEEPADYPDYAEKVATRVAGRLAQCGVLICGTGLGVSIAANKVAGIRAAMCNNTLLAHFARAHNDANVLTMGGRIVDEAQARKILDTWFSTSFAGGRHEQRVEKITAIEQHLLKEKKS